MRALSSGRTPFRKGPILYGPLSNSAAIDLGSVCVGAILGEDKSANQVADPVLLTVCGVMQIGRLAAQPLPTSFCESPVYCSVNGPNSHRAILGTAFRPILPLS